MDRVTVWLLPAATLNGEAGEVVTPAGNPESATVTEPVNPFCAVVDTVKVELELPAFPVIEAGETPKLKSCAGLTFKAICAECVSAEDVPLAVIVKFPAGTVTGMDKVTTWLLPATALNGDAGEVVTPGGRPEIVIAIEPANPFLPVVDIVKVVLESPASTEIVDGDRTIPKSWAGGGGGELEGITPLQPMKLNSHKQVPTNRKGLRRVLSRQSAKRNGPFPRRAHDRKFRQE